LLRATGQLAASAERETSFDDPQMRMERGTKAIPFSDIGFLWHGLPACGTGFQPVESNGDKDITHPSCPRADV